MHVIELWNTNANWSALTLDERQEAVAATVLAMKDAEVGATCLGWGTAGNIDHQAPYEYVSVWSFDDEHGARAFLDTLATTPWHRYCEQVNVIVALSDPSDVVGAMMSHA
jgi:hypothetical protein